MAKKVIGWIVLAFAIYWLVTAPEEAAEAVRSAGGGLRSAGESVVRFFDALSS